VVSEKREKREKNWSDIGLQVVAGVY